ncbi:hypothetical protein DDQ41_20895 [Streptomyces spongiicola]|uniref:Uncharacterized protein n=1 Tax=Streptomyces spongiicola TaxID=1690221 RepID=A0ABN5KS67_9ACTN|nr:hypothetical protein DDQ41_20895 [Streptomyces spongiicola]
MSGVRCGASQGAASASSWASVDSATQRFAEPAVGVATGRTSPDAALPSSVTYLPARLCSRCAARSLDHPRWRSPCGTAAPVRCGP